MMRCDDGIIYDDDFLMSDGTGKFVLIDKHGKKMQRLYEL